MYGQQWLLYDLSGFASSHTTGSIRLTEVVTPDAICDPFPDEKSEMLDDRRPICLWEAHTLNH